MDFFERQDTARRYTKWLLVYYPIALVLIVGSVYVVVALVFSRDALWNPMLFVGVTVGTLLLIAGATLVKINELRGGGGTVASLLGGVPVDPNTRDLDERKLLNVVEEMAIASGTPVPEVWVLRDEPGINAFAAGHDINDAAVAVTNGAMRLLSRDELQGVIAHEFSHILNSDVRLNVRVMGLLHGILILALLGRVLMRTRGRKNPLPVVGFGLFLIGSTGFFFGKLIRSAVSRQREYLADASAVQFTRNPPGLAGALKKIGGLEQGSTMMSGNAEEASHFFFANGVSGFFSGLMSTHPPLEKRIRLLDPAFDGKYPVVLFDDKSGTGLLQSKTLRDGRKVFALSDVETKKALDRVGAPAPEHLYYASDFREKLPAPLNVAAHEPMEAMRLVFALLLSPDTQMRATQVGQLGQHAEATRRLATIVNPLPVTFRLPLVSLALPALRRLSPPQYEEFSQCMEMLVACDKEVDLFEYTLKKIVSRHLRPSPPQPVQYYSLNALLPDCAVLISALARMGQGDLANAKVAFDRGMRALTPESGMALLTLNECGLDQIDDVLTRLAQTSSAIKKRVLHGCAHAVASDNVIQAEEAELLRAIAETLDCPIPPFIEGV